LVKNTLVSYLPKYSRNEVDSNLKRNARRKK
jgi:hypothetical protein